MAKSTTKSREIEITRTLNAPRELVYQAWTEPWHFTNWWGAPLETISMDVKPGGKWKAKIVSDEGDVPFRGVYKEVEAPEKLAYTLVDENDSGDGELVTVTFTERGSKTEMKFHQAGSLPEDQIAEAEAGWNAFFDALADYLAKAKKAKKS